jgi:large subunit ribosomal protein L19
MKKLLDLVEKSHLKKNPPEIQVGDTVRVKVLIREGKKERAQAFEGTVISIQGGSVNKAFTVRRIFQGVGVERTFMWHSPKVDSVKVLRKGKTRRAKLYFLRNRIGTKATRLREDIARIAKDAAAATDQSKNLVKESSETNLIITENAKSEE